MHKAAKHIQYLLILIAIAGCKVERQDVIPDVFIDIQINLSNIEYQPLQFQGGSVTIDGGVRGIIVHHKGNNNYRVFERNCPYQPSEECSVVEVDASLLFIKCPCCGSQFDFEGNVISAPAYFPLKQYANSVNGNIMRIWN